MAIDFSLKFYLVQNTLISSVAGVDDQPIQRLASSVRSGQLNFVYRKLTGSGLSVVSKFRRFPIGQL